MLDGTFSYSNTNFIQLSNPFYCLLPTNTWHLPWEWSGCILKVIPILPVWHILINSFFLVRSCLSVNECHHKQSFHWSKNSVETFKSASRLTVTRHPACWGMQRRKTWVSMLNRSLLWWFSANIHLLFNGWMCRLIWAFTFLKHYWRIFLGCGSYNYYPS